MQVKRNHTVCAGRLDRIGADPGADRDPGFVLLVAFRIAEIGHDDRHRLCARAFQRVNPKEEFHEMVIGGKDRRLHEVAATTTNDFLDAKEEIALGKANYLYTPRLHPQILADLEHYLRVDA